jgi:uncharacterized beta-barrel protein YwiB (DUF1934 family)
MEEREIRLLRSGAVAAGLMLEDEQGLTRWREREIRLLRSGAVAAGLKLEDERGPPR